MLRRANRRLARLAALVLAMVVLAATPAFAEDGLRIEGDTTYDIVPAQGRTTVSSTITVTNETTDRVVGGVLRRSFFNGLTVGASAGARNFIATSSGANLSVTTSPVNEAIQRADIAFPSMFSGQRRTIVLRYDIVGDAPRAEGVSRANPAYVSFVALAIGDDTLASVRVNVPPGFEVETVGSRIDEDPSGNGGTTLTASGFLTSKGWGVVVSARNDHALQSIDADAGERDVVVRAWPNDTEWQRFVVAGVGEGIPVLEELIGQPWPIKSQLQITEATSSYLRGYAGWFSPLDNTIEVGENLDYETLLHELSHAWFNRGMFIDRWINEGFAEEYAAQSLKRLGKPVDEVALDTNSRFAVRLTDWGNPQTATGDAAGREAYGYHTAAWLMRQLTDEIGLAGMAKVVRAAADDTPAYGDTPNEFGDIDTNTHRLLDLLENVGESKKASDLFEKYVTRESDASLYDTRAASRTTYATLVERGGSWTPPAVVRQELGGWHFSVADLRMTEARTVLDKRDEIAALAAQAAATVPGSLESDYEKADGDLSKVIETADRQLGAATTLAETNARLDANRSITEKVGLWFAHPSRKLDEARVAFADDDTARATVLSAAVQREIDHADTVGLQRIGLALAAVLLLLVAALVLRWALRRRRRPDADSQAAPPPPAPPLGPWTPPLSWTPPSPPSPPPPPPSPPPWIPLSP
jgi:hypothetical protein